MVCFRELFLLQLVGVVVSYNFTNCNFKNIVKDYEHVISVTLRQYINGRRFDQDQSCYSLPDCLGRIERHTLRAPRQCRAQFLRLAEQTRGALRSHCAGYGRAQKNNTQEMEDEEATTKCQRHASHIRGWWCGFSQRAGD